MSGNKGKGGSSGLIQKLPFVMGATAAILIGIVSYSEFAGSQNTYLRMAVAMAVFYIIGMYIQSVVSKINDEIEEKKRKEEAERLEQERQEMELQQQQNGVNPPSRVDIRVDDSDDFEPLTVRQVIRNNISEGSK